MPSKIPPISVRIPADLDELVKVGMKREGKTRHAYIIACVRHVASKEKTDTAPAAKKAPAKKTTAARTVTPRPKAAKKSAK